MATVRIRRLNGPQKAVLVIGVGMGLYLLGQWFIGLWEGDSFGWVAYAPLSQATPPVAALSTWVRLLVWLALTAIWVLISLGILSTRNDSSATGDSSDIEVEGQG
jgi:hypothetical protein